MIKKMKKQYLLMQAITAILFLFGGVFLLSYGIVVRPEQFSWVIVFSVILLLLGAFYIFIILKVDFQAFVDDYLSKNPGISMQDLENDFNGSKTISSRVWLGRRWTFYIEEGGFPNFLENSEIIWAYYYVRWLGKTRNSFVYAYKRDKELIKIPIRKKNAKMLLKLYRENHHISTKYNIKLLQWYNNDYDEFIRQITE